MGIGCRKDALAANHWYSKAAQHGDQRAVHRMAAINAASTGADPVTAALPVGKSRALKPGESSANIGPGKFVAT
jgi:TPR repeat protein